MVMLFGAVTVPVRETVVPAVATRLLELRLPDTDKAPVGFKPPLVVSNVIVFMVPELAATLPVTVKF